MAFSKYDPYAPATPADAPTDASAARRAKVLKWANWIVYTFTLVGFGFLAWALWRS